MPAPTNMLLIIAPPPTGWNGTVAQLFQLLENNARISVPPGFLIGGIGDTLPMTNIGPFLLHGTAWYFWDSIFGGYLPESTEQLIGSVVYFAQPTINTSIYIYCNGAAISRSAPYNLLFAQIGTRFGAGDGSTTFNLPNYPDIVSGTVHNKAAIRYA